MTLRALLDGLPIPILQAPMVGASGEALALAVCDAGGMGNLGFGATAPADIGPAVAGMRERTDRPFGVNLLMADPWTPEPDVVDAATARLAEFYGELGLSPPERPNTFAPDFQAQLQAVIAAAPPVASFTFCCLTREQVSALHAAGTLVVGTATTVAEARAWADVGADGICAQGAEAGGHRGHFLADLPSSLVGTLALVPTIRAAVDLPVIAAGGIMNGRGVAGVLALGASAVQMGTAFLRCDEAVTSKPWRDALAAAGDDATRLTRAFTGRYARGVENGFMRQMHGVEGEVPDYPVQNRLTQPLRAAAAAAGRADLISLWAGQGAALGQEGSAREMMTTWWREAAEAAGAVMRRTKGDTNR